MLQFVVFHPDDPAAAEILRGLFEIYPTGFQQADIMAPSGQVTRQGHACCTPANNADIGFQQFGCRGVIQINKHND
jgi:hypothetical protein